MKPSNHCSRLFVLAVVFHVVAACLASDDARAEASAAASAEAATARDTTPAPRPPIQTFEDGNQRLLAVDYGTDWSLHFETMNTDTVFRLWHQAGGPEMITKTVIDRPFTASVHHMKAERVVETLLDGYGYTLHYDASGRLALVRVYSPEEAKLFKTPRLVENLGRWRELETPAPPAPTDSPDASAPVDAPEADPPTAPR